MENPSGDVSVWIIKVYRSVRRVIGERELMSRYGKVWRKLSVEKCAESHCIGEREMSQVWIIGWRMGDWRSVMGGSVEKCYLDAAASWSSWK